MSAFAHQSLHLARSGHFIFRHGAIKPRIKRATDLALAISALALAIPILAVAVVAIKLDDGGPVLFKQKRVGRYGRLFEIFKLRTMRTESSGYGHSPTAARDPRVTRVGHFLRKTSIDELPQLLNVLRGEMSIVGPRPEQPFLVKNYQAWQHLRHLVKPGITCLWQIRCRSTIPLHEPAATVHDLEYIQTASPLQDSAIVLGTIKAVITSQGAY